MCVFLTYMTDVTADKCSTSVQERVRTRAYFLYVDGSKDEKKNYFQVWRIVGEQFLIQSLLVNQEATGFEVQAWMKQDRECPV